ncbi:unnamed protein product [Clonostachys rosea]|uniref:Xylanolytic transcriptional activator regulatory domain-containing protein n=1 Tax=Bionectria ochroleuca TaxID=29856 RepID=A0ABY6UF63_BIOOC|nr:unnamed protein product [Clonostachys rosea]
MIPLSAGINKYVGPSSGFSIAKLVFARVDEASGHRLGAHYTGANPAEGVHCPRLTICPSPIPTTKQQAMKISRIYFEQLHHRYPFLHGPSHMKHISAVYDDPQASTMMRFQVTMVLGISATILSRRLRAPFNGEGICVTAMELIEQIDFQSSLEGIQCLLLLYIFTLHSPFLSVNPWYLNYQCLAAVSDLGLQQQLPSGHSIDPFEREMRARIFWVVFSFDKIIATTLGRPVALSDEARRLELPRGFDDSQLEAMRHDDASLPMAVNVNSPMACSTIHFQFALFNSEIISVLHSHERSQHQFMPSRLPEPELWQGQVYNQLLAIRSSVSTMGGDGKYLTSLCEIRYHEIVMLLFRPTPRIPKPKDESLMICYRSAEATISLWSELHEMDRMSFAWPSVHSISLSAILILYCVWMVKDLSDHMEIDTLMGLMSAASDLLSASGEYWIHVRSCRKSLNRLTRATIQWLMRLRASPTSGTQPAQNSTTDHPASSILTGAEYGIPSEESASVEQSEEASWVDSYINGEDLALLFKTADLSNIDLIETMGGMFSEYPPILDFYQSNELGTSL